MNFETGLKFLISKNNFKDTKQPDKSSEDRQVYKYTAHHRRQTPVHKTWHRKNSSTQKMT